MNTLKPLIAAIAALGLAAGLLAPAIGFMAWAERFWAAAIIIVLAALIAEIVAKLSRREVGLDLVAALSMSAALLFGETLAGAVEALMYAGGQLLEEFAENRARTEMKALLGRVPKRALRYRDSHLEEVAIEALKRGDRILVRQGETVPADGVVAGGTALLDEAVITGESLPVKCAMGEAVMSGSVSLDMAFDVTVTQPAAQSTYAGIVRLIEAAQQAKAPMVRLADRFAVWFLLLTLVIAGGAWFLTGDRIRALAVLVVATPCPLILAVPVAIVSGISHAARRGVLVKGGPVLETLAKAVTLVIDKTGTLTRGQANLTAIESLGNFKDDDILRLAASLDQASGHPIAASIVATARERKLPLTHPSHVRETGGTGIIGEAGGHRVAVGGTSFVVSHLKRKPRQLAKPEAPPGSATVAVAIDGKLAGFLIFADEVRPDAGLALEKLKHAGISRIVLASGDDEAVVLRIAGILGISDAKGELSPRQKVDMVLAQRRHGPVLMAGDGVNDAPALAAADAGIAMGVRGAAASAEAADAVLLVDNLERIAEAVTIAKRSRGIALQSVYAGLGLSIAAMFAAAFGYLTPVQGALFQEAIDVAVILNALRALR
jgi:heavy metal translocating P-type ATPase